MARRPFTVTMAFLKRVGASTEETGARIARFALTGVNHCVHVDNRHTIAGFNLSFDLKFVSLGLYNEAELVLLLRKLVELFRDDGFDNECHYFVVC